jgi:hypothetical protein
MGLKESSPSFGCLDACVHIVSRSATVFGFFIVISSMVLMSLTPSHKALMISMSRMYGISFLVLQKHLT